MVIETAQQQLAEAEEAYRLLGESTAPMYRAWGPHHVAHARLRVGDIDGARPAVPEFLAVVARSGPGAWQQIGPVQEYYLAFWDGDVAAAIAACQKRKEFDSACPEVDVSRFEGCARSLLLTQIASVAVAELDVGDSAAAQKRRAVRETVAFESGDPEPPALVILGGYAGELFARTGGHADAQIMYDAASHLRPGAGDVSGVLKAFPSVERECAWWASILGDHDEADDHLEASVAVHRERNSPTNVALDHLVGAWIHHLRGDDADARAHLDAAWAAAPADWPRFDQRVGALRRSVHCPPNRGT